MARRLQSAEINTFVAGLVTDASPLTFPDNASLMEENFVLNRDGSRQRRLGMNYETGHKVVDSGQANTSSIEIGRSAYKWENAGGDAGKSLLVIQFGQRLDIFDLDKTIVSSGLIQSYNFTIDPASTFSYAEVDGLLVVASGLSEISILSYSSGTITKTQKRIFVRDLFGLEDIFNGEDLLSGSGVQTRPNGLIQAHNYNLKNQGWGVPRIYANFDEFFLDPIYSFLLARKNLSDLYPSNADRVSEGLYADSTDQDNRITQRFFPNTIYENPVGSSRAANGHYVIDLLTRGASRLQEFQKTKARYPEINYLDVSNIPEDYTPGGASIVAEFAGRAWFAGFSGKVINGDARSPRLSSYLVFSKLVESTDDITRCYQEADPTSVTQNDLVDTDGGFIRIDGAYGIKKLINIGTKLVVVASNGVWIVQGGSDYGFTATSYKVSRVSEHGCVSTNSIVVVENTVMFWGEDGIYHVTSNEFGDTVVENLVLNRIQTLYNAIDHTSKEISSGHYDTYERSVRWLYNTSIGSSADVLELVLDFDLKAFYLNRISTPDRYVNRPVLLVDGNSYITSSTAEQVVADGVSIVAGSDSIVVDLGGRDGVTRELLYVTVVSISPTIKYTISKYSDTDFVDWKSSNDVGVDAEAFMITGYLSGGDFYRDKSVKYIQCYLDQTEKLLKASGDDFILINPSSCLTQVQWNWADSGNSGRWGQEFESYRLPRHYMVGNVSEGFDTGNSVTVSKSKLRGYGKVLSIKFRTKPKHDLKLFGWSLMMVVEDKT